MLPREIASLLRYTVQLRPFGYVRKWRDYKRDRGMSLWHDMVDWVGGLPFEVATPERIFNFYRDRGFVLERLATSTGYGCNQYVFRRE
jgi:2-polyprenyl-6-hydroxyphenyl methylase/3-demethylubiquinone-9 3-methyltransferase